MNNQRGETMISALIAALIVGLVAVLLISVYEQATVVWTRSKIIRETENIMRQVQTIFENRDMCDNSLRNTDNTRISWNGRSVERVGRIEAQPGTAIATVGMQVTPNLRIREMFVRPRDVDGNNLISGNEGMNPGILVRHQGFDHYVFAGEVGIQFEIVTPDATLGTAGGSLATMSGGMVRTIPILLAVANAGPNVGRIVACDLNDESSPNLACTDEQLNASGTNCPVPQPWQSSCTRYTYVNEINALGNPICGCTLICHTLAWSEPQMGQCSPGPTLPAGAPPCQQAVIDSMTPPNPVVKCTRAERGNFCYFKRLYTASAGAGCPNTYEMLRSQCK